MLSILNILQSSKLCYQFSFDETNKCRNGSNSNHNIAKQSIPFVLLFSILLRKALQIPTLGGTELFSKISGKRLLFSYVPKNHLHTSYKKNDRVIFKSLLKPLLLPLKTSQDLKVFPIYGKISNPATISRQQDYSLVPARSMENETVNASVRGQQECTTLILGGRMESELLRLSTLCNFPVFGISLLRLAEYGFYSEGNNDELVCFSCGNRVKGWTPNSDHSDVNNHYSNCQHVRKKNFAVPLEASGYSKDFTQKGKPNGNTEHICDGKMSSDLSIMCTDDKHDAVTANLIVSSNNNEEHLTNQSRTIGQAKQTETSSEANGNEVYPYISEKYGLSRGVGYSDNVVRREYDVYNNQNSESQGTGTHESSLMNGRQMFPPTNTREISVDGNTNITDSLNFLSLESEEEMPYFSGITENPRNNVPSVSHQPMIKQNGLLEGNQEQLTFKYDGRLVKMKYPNYEPLQKRRDSYFDWPANRDFLHPYDLAECGFFFTHFEDCVRCFHCGIGLRNWEEDDNPWVEHARWSRKCQYLIRRKGQEFIDSVVQLLGLETDEEFSQSSAPQLDREEFATTTRNPLEHNAAIYVMSEGIFDNEELVLESMTLLLETNNWHSITTELLVTSILEKNETTAYGISSGADIATDKVTNSRNNDIKNDENGLLDKPEITLPTKDLKPIDIDIERKSKDVDDPGTLQKENEELEDLYTCKICLDQKVGVTFLPCGHLVTCKSCSPKLWKCPLCRKFIRSTITTKI
ncbi:inhibitor of apoptosis protein-like isoform X2 [Mytilus galloprovincialis]|uniref:inhibitor of apoptosis protein-like isoform X2 n=1 Tax=Mytilus galloprovincialis TaxID=29158 RepID=UPI003F7C160C